MPHMDHDDGLTDPASRWDDDTSTDRAYDAWLENKFGDPS